RKPLLYTASQGDSAHVLVHTSRSRSSSPFHSNLLHYQHVTDGDELPCLWGPADRKATTEQWSGKLHPRQLKVEVLNERIETG
ncbi:hypothetical protein, partial [Brevibacterium aurantiacum]|uniref:hypothetical protein n=1 Tax=Brevibacterium aurantiacum TaxID=273384 RepID=UPI00196B0A97